MRIATWNVNSLKARMERVEEWLSYAQPDVLCMQETKMADSAFPSMAFQALGYESAHHGSGRWNGVAILSRVGMESVVAGFAGTTEDETVESRLISATCGGVRVSSVYVPNGRSLDSEHYQAKLEWLGELRDHLLETCDPDGRVAVCGDFNVAPDDRDVFDPAKFRKTTHTSAAERAAIGELCAWGLVDAFREIYDQERLYTWWDYRAGDFHQHRGMRIDLILVSRQMAKAATWGLIDRNARKGKSPSDHAPVLIDFEL
ncbi:MAG TPA: exodeoxyribonuclease III [Acidimicrobiales bacterium]|nr:exodeoxyribonuclease III [Acidimicrobiales bacterium]